MWLMSVRSLRIAIGRVIGGQALNFDRSCEPMGLLRSIRAFPNLSSDLTAKSNTLWSNLIWLQVWQIFSCLFFPCHKNRRHCKKQVKSKYVNHSDAEEWPNSITNDVFFVSKINSMHDYKVDIKVFLLFIILVVIDAINYRRTLKTS